MMALKVIDLPKADKESVNEALDIAKSANFQQIFILGFTEEGKLRTIANNDGENAITRKDACWMLTAALSNVMTNEDW